jgi:glycosyltransferase involved in cell wall biosynthesis
MGDRARSAGPRVVVDARALHGSGIGRYLREVLGALLVDTRFGEVALLGNPGELADFVAERGTSMPVRIEAHRGAFYTPRAQLSWRSLRLRGRTAGDVAFFPHYDAPLLGLPRRSVVAVQDLTHFKLPEAFAAWKRAGAGVLFESVVRSAARVVVSSASTRTDLLERVPSAAGRVEIIPLGVGASFRACRRGECATCDRTWALRPYLLCVGNRKPHKNLGAAVGALARLLPERPDLKLVIAGSRFAARDEVDAHAAALGIRHAVLEQSDITDAELRCLYTHAEALLFPSLYEGFGLPLLEAMACGAPVVASNRASIPEVVGDAGLLVDPTDPEAMAGAVRRLREDTALCAALVERGRERAASLSWAETARRTLDVLYATSAERAPRLASALVAR